ncbi:flagellar hook-basal body protein [Paenibacillus sambharensis]|uniref:Flagellar hook-basal body protein n=1 Tax=Paenibacillus sambharensis TaxID=1803190 RepID=A0A2W1LGJ8_9BACL|nr:flagellar hook-basal body protein [Paenibacillus sambharensis]PZD97809.1 flagellar hook-basal body protein [Paenibacillus sambharensis]
MNNSMINAMVSMGGLQQKLDMISDNIANANTAGYKRKDSTFQDLLTNVKQQERAFEQPVRLTPLGYNVGWGSRLAAMQPDMTQGAVLQTGSPYDFAIQGSALFEVAVDDQGNRAYTRSGSFQLSINRNNEQVLTTADGYPVIAQTPAGEGRVVVPTGYSVRVDAYGNIQAVSPDKNTVANLGQLKLVEPVKPGSLTATADNLYVIADGTDVDQVVQRILPADTNDVRVMQGFLEQSNVDMTHEMSELMIVQRAYQMSARALSSSDTMMGLANNLRA